MKPVVLCILDGWGHSCSSSIEYNAIARAKTPNLDAIFAKYPSSLLDASELYVGLPEGQMGNSEVGHMNIGAGRVILQDLPRIDKAINDGSLKNNKSLVELIKKTKESKNAVHIIGLLSDGGVHSHQRHMDYIAKVCLDSGLDVKVHAFLDGRDTPPKSALQYLERFESRDFIATISGRYYAMDRDKRWERVEPAFNAIIHASGDIYNSADEAIRKAYTDSITDEFVKPCIIGNYAGLKDGDSVIMINFRADRARQILTALTEDNFAYFSRGDMPKVNQVVGMVEYSSELSKKIPAVFPAEEVKMTLGEVVSKAGIKQLRIAETEKYPHVTYFFNGGYEDVFSGEERIMIPSPKVATYDLKPEMSAPELTEKLVEAINSKNYGLIVVNYANTDMVGHSGDVSAAIKAVEAVDECVGKVFDAVIKSGASMIISADHGNAETMMDEETKQPHTAHTLNKVPFVLIGEEFDKSKTNLQDGVLADIAPTILKLMELSKPDQMTGKVLF